MKRYETLYKVLTPHLRKKDKILDYFCGISPIAKGLVDEYEYIGFDYDEKKINKCKELFPNGTWDVKNCLDIDYKDIDVLIFLSSSFHPSDLEIFTYNIELLNPRVILTEMSMLLRYKGKFLYSRKKYGLTGEFVRFNYFMVKLGYKMVEKGTHNKEGEKEQSRFFQIWEK
jgi:hypothetical protein